MPGAADRGRKRIEGGMGDAETGRETEGRDCAGERR